MLPKKLNTLVVDDDETQRELIWSFLLENGGSTGTSTAKMGLTYLETCFFNVVISDFDMPEMTGLELLQAVRSHGSHIVRSVVFILTTGNSSDERKKLAIEAGTDGYLTKPYSKNDLHKQIESAFRRRLG